MEKNLEKRMYFFTIYQLTGIQAGIQCGHAALEYAMNYGRFNSDHIIWDFLYSHKTWIILNGGTTNKNRGFDGVADGTLNQIGDSLLENNIDFSYFMEPDLNDALTAVCFIADERVWNDEDYPNFIDYLTNSWTGNISSQRIVELRMTPLEILKETYKEQYNTWVDLMGGSKNVFLRELIKGKKLA